MPSFERSPPELVARFAAAWLERAIAFGRTLPPK